ncbi:MAG TPA: hypothetical protein VLE44_00915 [Candidatus Saccharimonadales bacterium]|nr:hypothetical protein [Candidatus Saccharimonadales bacterium]
MATLTQAAITTRKIVRYSIYLIIILIIGRIVLGLVVSVFKKVFPAPPPPPTVVFGKLPKLPFPDRKDIPALTYTVQTPEGGLPQLAAQAKVYFMPSSKPDLLALDTAKQKAASLGFSTNAQAITQTLYKFSNSPIPSTLQMNIVTGIFSISYDLNADPTPLAQKPPTPEGAASIARNFLSQGALLPDDLSGQTTQEYLKVDNKRLVTAISLSEASLTKINLFRKDYDKLPSLTSNPNQANVWFILSGAQESGKQIIGVQYYYYPVDETQFATYPLKTSDIAMKDLQASKGYVANLGNNPSGSITVRRIYLAYYDSGTPMQFYQPVVVFEGDNGFVAYVPAVNATYYSE